MSRSKFMQRVAGVMAAAALSVGMGVSTAAPAQAASNVWDRVAMCESSGNWHINTGNGYYGGLQFSPSTWRAYGGAKYGRTADKASKAEQIAIARRTLYGQGASAWACAGRAGLTKANGRAHPRAMPEGSSAKASAKKSTAKKHASAKKQSGKAVTVRPGDTLSKIAQRYHVQGGWKAVWKANKTRLSNPHDLRVGQVLRLK